MGKHNKKNGEDLNEVEKILLAGVALVVGLVLIWMAIVFGFLQ